MRLAPALACAAVLLGSQTQMQTEAQAQTYPSRPVTIVVTAAAGGVSDVIARAIGQKLAEQWGQQVVVENRGGGAHTLGATMVAKAPPDGHTLMVAESGTFVTNPIVHDKSKLPFDVEKEIAPVTGLIRINHALAVAPNAPVKDFADFIALARSGANKVTYGTTGVASATHLNMVMLESLAGAKMQAIHYRGATPAFTDVMAGHITGMLISAGTALPAWREGKIKLVGIGSKERVVQDVPTLSETVPNYRAGTWFGLATTTGTPAAVIEKINKDVIAIMRDPAFRDRYLKSGLFEDITTTPDAFAASMREEMQAWSQALTKAGFKLAE